MSAKDQVADPEGNYVFALEINGVEVAQFLECSGLKTSTEVYELQEGGMNFRVHKLPGQSRWENVTLRYGVTTDTTLLQWRDEILQDAACGDGPVDAALKTIDRITGIHGTLTDFTLQAITGGKDAMGEVSVRVAFDTGVTLSAKSASTDIIEAGARAYLSCVNRLIAMPKKAAEEITENP